MGRVTYVNQASSVEDSGDDSDTSDCTSDLPPPPVFMGPAGGTASETLKASRGRPRKDPPMLIPQVAKPTSSGKPQHILMHGDKEVPISRVRTISKTPLKGAKLASEVILLESDDSTVFSDEDGADDDDEETPSTTS